MTVCKRTGPPRLWAEIKCPISEDRDQWVGRPYSGARLAVAASPVRRAFQELQAWLARMANWQSVLHRTFELGSADQHDAACGMPNCARTARDGRPLGIVRWRGPFGARATRHQDPHGKSDWLAGELERFLTDGCAERTDAQSGGMRRARWLLTRVAQTVSAE